MENVKQFYEALASNEAMKEKAAKLNEGFDSEAPEEQAASAAIIAFAKSEGYDFTAAELTEYGRTVKTMKLSDDELEAVTGGSGGHANCWGACFCFAGGGGVHGEPKITCFCVAAGWGGECQHRMELWCGLAGNVRNSNLQDFPP